MIISKEIARINRNFSPSSTETPSRRLGKSRYNHAPQQRRLVGGLTRACGRRGSCTLTAPPCRRCSSHLPYPDQTPQELVPQGKRRPAPPCLLQVKRLPRRGSGKDPPPGGLRRPPTGSVLLALGGAGRSPTAQHSRMHATWRGLQRAWFLHGPVGGR